MKLKPEEENPEGWDRVIFQLLCIGPAPDSLVMDPINPIMKYMLGKAISNKRIPCGPKCN